MPELPEVETIVMGLKNSLEKKTITEVKVLNERTITHPKSTVEFYELLKNKEIVEVKRKGKYIDIILEGGSHLIIHLRMTGQLIFSETPMEFTHLRVRLLLNKGILYFNDIRKFGTMALLAPENLQLEKGYHSLGVEPLSEEFNLEYLAKKIRGGRPVKNFILDQSIIAGLGNIYADESLFLSNINPKRPINTLQNHELEALVRSIKEVLDLAIINRGTTFSDYKDSTGGKGSFQNFLKVYGRAKGQCMNCHSILVSDKLGGRTTVFCLNCQK